MAEGLKLALEAFVRAEQAAARRRASAQSIALDNHDDLEWPGLEV